MTKKEFKKLFAVDKWLWFMSRFRIELATYWCVIPPEHVGYLPVPEPDTKSTDFHISKWRSRVYSCPKAEKWFCEDQLKYWQEVKRKEIMRESNIKKYHDDIGQVKQIPILEVLDRYGIKHTRQSNNREQFAIRQEKTPSCVAYLDNNSWYDFGSGDGGSVIDILIHRNKLTIAEAIKELKEML